MLFTYILFTLQLILTGVQSLPTTYNETLIDVHHHFVPDFYAQAVAAAGGDPSGWPVPSWNVSASEAFMSQIGMRAAILSLTSPGASIAPDNASARTLARLANNFCANVRDQKPSKFGFFAAMPNLLDTEGALAEIRYALDVLKADGVTLFTRYGNANYYLGHPEFDPIWSELHARKAIVFVHPTSPVDLGRANPALLQPTIDYPHETTRTAMDLLISGNRRKYPNCTIILPHAGGNLPWLISRVALWRRGLTAQQIPDGITYEQYMSEFRSFWYDLALSASPEKMDYLLKMIPNDQLLYGSDFPYAPATGIANFRSDLESYPMSPELRRKIYSQNALKLIPRLGSAGN